MSSDEDFTEDVSEPCPEGRGVTHRRFRRLSSVARLHLHPLPGSLDRRRASMPACRRMPVLTKARQTQARQERQASSRISATTWLDRNRRL